MKKKTGVILSSAAAIAVCASVMAGSTYALFTSESKTDIVVKSATVDVRATIDNIEAKHSVWNAETGAYEATGEGLFSGNSVAEVDGTIALNEVAPGDLVTFDIVIENNSTIDVQYRVKMVCTEGVELLSGLNLTVDGEDFSGLVSYVSEWQQWSGDKKVVPVTIELPVEAGNEYQGLSCKISYSVEAIQGNGNVNNDDAKLIKTKVATAAELKAALDFANENGGEIVLTDDVNDIVALPELNNDVKINLNNHALTTSKNLSVSENANVVISNGTIETVNSNARATSGNDRAITVSGTGKLTLNNVNISVSNVQYGYGIVVYDGATVEINGGNIYGTVCGISTDAGNGNYTAEQSITVNNATLSGDYCGILYNINATLTLNNCDISGYGQAAVIRGGNVTMNGCTLTKLAVGENASAWVERAGSHSTYANYYTNSWGGGTNVPDAALVVGNRTTSTYQYATNLKLLNVTIVNETEQDDVYVYGNAKADIGVTLVHNLDESVVINNAGGATTVVKVDLVINNVEDLIAFANAVNNGNTFAGKTVLLTNDIDLAGATFDPIGTVAYDKDATVNQGITTSLATFAGTFDGQGHTISNYVYNGNGVRGAGLFGYVLNATIKNVSVKNVNYINTPYSGAIVGVAIGDVTVENCHVENYTAIGSRQMGGLVGYANHSSGSNGCRILNSSVKDITITAVPELLANGEYDNGDKVGCILGYEQNSIEISGCTVENATLTAYRDLGGIAGMLQYNKGSVKITNNTVTNVTLVVDTVNNSYGKAEADLVATANKDYGRIGGTGEFIDENNEMEEPTVEVVK